MKSISTMFNENGAKCGIVGSAMMVVGGVALMPSNLLLPFVAIGSVCAVTSAAVGYATSAFLSNRL